MTPLPTSTLSPPCAFRSLHLVVLCRMIVEPEQRVADFIKAGSDIVSVHAEQSATIHLHRLVNNVSFKCTAWRCQRLK